MEIPDQIIQATVESLWDNDFAIRGFRAKILVGTHPVLVREYHNDREKWMASEKNPFVYAPDEESAEDSIIQEFGLLLGTALVCAEVMKS